MATYVIYYQNEKWRKINAIYNDFPNFNKNNLTNG